MASSQFDAPSFMHDTLHAIEIDCLERRVVATLERIPNDESKVAVLRNVCDVFGVLAIFCAVSGFFSGSVARGKVAQAGFAPKEAN